MVSARARVASVVARGLMVLDVAVAFLLRFGFGVRVFELRTLTFERWIALALNSFYLIWFQRRGALQLVISSGQVTTKQRVAPYQHASECVFGLCACRRATHVKLWECVRGKLRRAMVLS